MIKSNELSGEISYASLDIDESTKILQECNLDVLYDPSKLQKIHNSYLKELNSLVWSCDNEIALRSGISNSIRETRLQTKVKIKKIQKAVATLRKELNDSPKDIGLIPAPNLEGVSMMIQNFLYSNEDTRLIEKMEIKGGDSVEVNCEVWEGFRERLELYHIQLNEFSAYMKNKSKRGRPKEITSLTIFMEKVIKIYEELSGQKFTVCEYGDESSTTKGMSFARAYMNFVRCRATFSNEFFYSAENIFNAMETARKNLVKNNIQSS